MVTTRALLDLGGAVEAFAVCIPHFVEGAARAFKDGEELPVAIHIKTGFTFQFQVEK